MDLPLTLIAALIAGIASLGLLLDAVEVLLGRHRLAMLFDESCARQSRGPRGWSVASGAIAVLFVANVLFAVLTAWFLYIGHPLAAATAAGVAVLLWNIEGRFATSGTSATRMQIIIWLTLALFALAGDGSPAQMAAMGFLAFQSAVGYIMAGVEKLRSPFWIDGSAIRRVLTSDAFGTPRVAAVLPLGVLSAPLSWSALAFEIGGPLVAITAPEAALAFCILGVLFHLGIALLMGITQFLFAFGATYPAVYVSVVWLHEHLL